MGAGRTLHSGGGREPKNCPVQIYRKGSNGYENHGACRVLILTRRIEETVGMTCPDGTKINVKVLGLNTDEVRIGIDAPKDVQILRDDAKRRYAKD